jgi:hypothetical protein
MLEKDEIDLTQSKEFNLWNWLVTEVKAESS